MGVRTGVSSGVVVEGLGCWVRSGGLVDQGIYHNGHSPGTK